jgi:hypothetical protein
LITYDSHTVPYPQPIPPPLIQDEAPRVVQENWEGYLYHRRYSGLQVEKTLVLEIGGDSCAVSMSAGENPVVSEIIITRESTSKVDLLYESRIELSLGLESVAVVDELVRKNYNFDLCSYHETCLEPVVSEIGGSRSSSRTRRSKKIVERKRSKKIE